MMCLLPWHGLHWGISSSGAFIIHVHVHCTQPHTHIRPPTHNTYAGRIIQTGQPRVLLHCEEVPWWPASCVQSGLLSHDQPPQGSDRESVWTGHWPHPVNTHQRARREFISCVLISHLVHFGNACPRCFLSKIVVKSIALTKGARFVVRRYL